MNNMKDFILQKKEKVRLMRTFLVGEDGFEPSKLKATDLQSAPFGHSGIPPYEVSRTAEAVNHVEPVDGLEPPTC